MVPTGLPLSKENNPPSMPVGCFQEYAMYQPMASGSINV